MTKREGEKLDRLVDRVALTWLEFMHAWGEHSDPRLTFRQELNGKIGPYWEEHLDAEDAVYRHIDLCWLAPADYAIRYPDQ